MPENAGEAQYDHEMQRHGERGQHRVAFAPEPELFQRGNRARFDGFMIEKTPEIVGKFLRGAITPAWLFLQTLQADGLQIHRHARIQPTRRDWINVLHLKQNVLQGFTLKRRVACDEVVKNGAQ